MGFRVCLVERRDSFKVWRNADDVLTHWLNHRFVIPRFIGGEPIAGIVFLKFIEELEKVFWETIELRDHQYGYL